MSGNFVVSQTTPCRPLPHLWLFYVTCWRHTSRLDCIRYIYHVHIILEGVIRPGKLASALLIPCPILTLIYPSPLLQLPSRRTSHNPSSVHMAHRWLWAFGTPGYFMATTYLPFLPHNLPSLFLRPRPSGRRPSACNHVPRCTYYPPMAKYDLFAPPWYNRKHMHFI